MLLVDCEWHPWKCEVDCQKNLEKEFNGTDPKCYPLASIHGLKHYEKLAVMEEVLARMESKDLYQHPEDNHDPESLKTKLKKTCKGGER